MQWEWLNIMTTIGVGVVGYIAFEIRGLRTDLVRYGERIARLEGVLDSASDGPLIR
jgi:hypothetical protein